MNWNGGSLNRAGYKQKRHFAKARTRASYAHQSASSFSQQKIPLVNTVQSLHIPSNPAVIDPSEYDLLMKRQELLQRPDWLGLSLTKPLQIEFEAVSDKAKIGRRREVRRKTSPQRLLHSQQHDLLGRLPMRGLKRGVMSQQSSLKIKIGSGALDSQTQQDFEVQRDRERAHSDMSSLSEEPMLLDSDDDLFELGSASVAQNTQDVDTKRGSDETQHVPYHTSPDQRIPWSSSHCIGDDRRRTDPMTQEAVSSDTDRNNVNPEWNALYATHDSNDASLAMHSPLPPTPTTSFLSPFRQPYFRLSHAKVNAATSKSYGKTLPIPVPRIATERPSAPSSRYLQAGANGDASVPSLLIQNHNAIKHISDQTPLIPGHNRLEHLSSEAKLTREHGILEHPLGRAPLPRQHNAADRSLLVGQNNMFEQPSASSSFIRRSEAFKDPPTPSRQPVTPKQLCQVDNIAEHRSRTPFKPDISRENQTTNASQTPNDESELWKTFILGENHGDSEASPPRYESKQSYLNVSSQDLEPLDFSCRGSSIAATCGNDFQLASSSSTHCQRMNCNHTQPVSSSAYQGQRTVQTSDADTMRTTAAIASSSTLFD